MTFSPGIRLFRLRDCGFILSRLLRLLPGGQNSDDGTEPQDGGHVGRLQLRNGSDGKHADDENRQPVSAKLFRKKLQSTLAFHDCHFSTLSTFT